MRALTIAMPYYRNAGMLEKHQAEWARYPDEIRKRMTVLIADDGSPDGHALEAAKPCDYSLQIYRIGINKPWNHCGARNLAMHHAPEGWVLVTDIDHLLTRKNAIELCSMPVQRRHYYIPARRLAPEGDWYKPHPNSYYLERSLFWETGGCDEDFSGWYGSDSTFRKMIATLGTRVELKSPALWLYGRDVVHDASTREWGRKDTEYHVSNNPALREKRHGAPYKATNPLRFPWERVL